LHGITIPHSNVSRSSYNERRRIVFLSTFILIRGSCSHFPFSYSCLRNSLLLIMLYVFIFSKHSFRIFFLLRKPSHFIIYFFLGKSARLKLLPLFNISHQLRRICLYLYIHTPFPVTASILLTTRLPITVSLLFPSLFRPLLHLPPKSKMLLWQISSVLITFHSRAHGTFITRPSISYSLALNVHSWKPLLFVAPGYYRATGIKLTVRYKSGTSVSSTLIFTRSQGHSCTGLDFVCFSPRRNTHASEMLIASAFESDCVSKL
jgi:hypothetical protein